MEEEVQKLIENKIDIDLIKDEQNPIYQNVDIRRKRLLSVLDRALDKIAIAYALEDLLNKNLKLLGEYMTQNEIDNIIKTFNKARFREETPIFNSILKRSTRKLQRIMNPNKSVGSFSFRSNSTLFRARSSLTSYASQDKELMAKTQRIKTYYAQILTKLQFIPEIPSLAKEILSQKPVKDIIYYVYLVDLRNYVCRIIYETKTEELNHKKNVKKAYVQNLKEKPQAEIVKNILIENRNEKKAIVQELKDKIENEKILQAEMNLKLLCDASDVIVSSEDNIIERTIESHQIQEERKAILGEKVACYNKIINENIATIAKFRKRNRKIEVTLRNILDNYDNTIGELHAIYENIDEVYTEVKTKYDALKIKFDLQEPEFVELMAERKELVEMTCLRICYNRAAKTVQRWWRRHLMKKWKWRKTYLMDQLKRGGLSSSQQKKLKKAIKKLREKHKEHNKRFGIKT